MRLISNNFIVFTFYLHAFRYARMRGSSSLDTEMIMRDESRFELHELIERLLNIFSRHSLPSSHISNVVYYHVCTPIAMMILDLRARLV